MFKQLQADFERYHVLAYRDQNLSKDDLIRFTNLWGSVGAHVQRGGLVHTISNADANGNPTGSIPETGALHFHADKSYMKNVALATFLYGVQVPPVGADTLFADMAMAYDALSPEMKKKSMKAPTSDKATSIDETVLGSSLGTGGLGTLSTKSAPAKKMVRGTAPAPTK